MKKSNTIKEFRINNKQNLINNFHKKHIDEFEDFVKKEWNLYNNVTTTKIIQSDNNLKMKNHIKCVKCKKVVFIGTKYKEKRIKKYGSEKKMRKNYLCRNCK